MIRKSLYCTVVGLLLSFGCSAQFIVGFKGGLNVNTIREQGKVTFWRTEKKMADGYSTIGFNGGAFGKYQVLGFLAARVEILYSQQGGFIQQYDAFPPELVHDEARLQLHNIMIPVIAEFQLPSMSESKVQPKLYLGGYYGLAIDANNSYSKTTAVQGFPSISERAYTSVITGVEQNQYGVIVGLGADFLMSDKTFSLEFRYQHTLNDVSGKNATNNPYLGNTVDFYDGLYLSTFSINLGVSIFNF